MWTDEEMVICKYTGLKMTRYLCEERVFGQLVTRKINKAKKGVDGESDESDGGDDAPGKVGEGKRVEGP